METRALWRLLSVSLFLASAYTAPASACVVGNGTQASCTEAAFVACLPGGATFDGSVTFNCGSTATVVVSNRRWITADTTIDGDGRITLSGELESEILGVDSGAKLTLRNLIIAKGRSAFVYGGGIVNGGILEAFGVNFWQNTAVRGGGVLNANGAKATFHSCTFMENGAGFGGAIANEEGGVVSIFQGSFFDNAAYDAGGSIGEFLTRGDGTEPTGSFNRAFEFSARAQASENRTATAGEIVQSFAGAAVGNYGTATIDSTAFTTNTAVASSSYAAAGAAIANGGDLVVTRSEFAQNSTSGPIFSVGAAGGAIVNTGTIVVTNNTFTDNSTTGGTGSPLGGAILVQGTGTITNSTFASNGPGGAVSNDGSPAGTLTIRNTILATSSGGNCVGSPIDGGNNIDDGTSCDFSGGNCSNPIGSSRCSTNPRLDGNGLQWNGGWTLTHALCTAAGVPHFSCSGPSPAISAGNSFLCSSTGKGAVGSQDQRGYARPGTGAANCSIGAFEASSQPASVPYVALGDSYSSGEGVEPFFTDSNTTSIWSFPRNACHRSKAAYPLLDPLFDGSASKSTSPAGFLACSGATTANVRTDVLRASNPISEPAQLGRGLIGYETELITISVGGNDVGFGDIVSLCVRDRPSDREKCERLLSPANVSERIANLVPKLEATYDEIRALAFGWTTIVVLGYPRLVSGSSCPAVKGSYDGGWFTMKLDLNSEVQELIRNAADALNAAIARSARNAGFTFVSVADAFEGHEVCSSPGPSWIHGIVDPSGPKRVYSFHPNEDGHIAYADRIAECISPYAPDDCNAEVASFAPVLALGSAAEPLSFGTLYVTSATEPGCDTQVHPAAGKAIRVEASGFAPQSNVELVLASIQTDSTAELGMVQADEDGNVDETVTLPADIDAPDVVTISGEGTGEHGEDRFVEIVIGVQASYNSDADGDAVPDICDNCRNAVNLGQADTDGDGAGDPCDGCVDTPGSVCPSPAAMCGDVNGSGDLSASDALVILRAAVGGNQCDGRVCVCDVNASGSINATDALTTLRAAVGQSAAMNCPCE